jgi:threonine/homoserine/homoserine lactone efflux protein
MTTRWSTSRRRYWRTCTARGIVVNVLNPKTPDLLSGLFAPVRESGPGPDRDPDRGARYLLHIARLACDSTYALLSGTVSGRLRRAASLRGHLDRVSGVIYLGLGATAELAAEGGRKA